jgi:O-antigen/teichoic acid export membrane protein
VVLARLLGPEQLGVAATLVVTASFFDLISDTGSDRFLIQDRDGDTPEVQKLVHLVYAGRGVAVALALVAFAIPVAHFYKTPALAGGLAVLALSPLILGFQHLDYRRLQRAHNFRLEALCMMCAECACLLATTVAALVTRSFEAVLVGLITRALVLVLVSHILAKRAYRIGWEAAHARRLSQFALPLMLNGLMLFVVSQGDRVIVGRELGVKALGYYSAAMLLVYYPSVLLARYIHAIYIPLIAAQRDSDQRRRQMIDDLGGQTIILTIAMTLGFALVAPSIIPVLFGRRFQQDALLVALIGILQMARFIFNWPSTASLAMGRSGTVLASNLTHFLAFASAVAGYALIGGLQGVVAGFIVGELICAVAAIVLLNRDTGQPVVHGLGRLAEFVAACGVVLIWDVAVTQDRLPLWIAAIAASLVLAVWLYRREEQAIRSSAALVQRTISQAMKRLGLAAWPRTGV